MIWKKQMDIQIFGDGEWKITYCKKDANLIILLLIVVIFMKLEIQILFIYLTEFPELLIEKIHTEQQMTTGLMEYPPFIISNIQLIQNQIIQLIIYMLFQHIIYLLLI